MSPPALLLILTDRPAAIPAERFDAWYETEHIPERLATPGFLWAARFVAARGGSPQHMALYGLSGEHVLLSAAYKRLLDKTQWSRDTAEIFPAIAAINRRIVLEYVSGEIPDAETLTVLSSKAGEGEALGEWVGAARGRAWFRDAAGDDFVFTDTADGRPRGAAWQPAMGFRRTFLRHA